MLVLGRGHTTYTEVPDPPAPVVTTTIGRSAELPTIAAVADIPLIVSGAPQMTFPAPDFFTAPGSPAATPTLFTPAINAAIEQLVSANAPHPAVAIDHVSFAALQARAGEAPVVIMEPFSFANLLSNGWFIVPSAANEYGDTYASADEFTWDVAAGEFTADWFFV